MILWLHPLFFFDVGPGLTVKNPCLLADVFRSVDSDGHRKCKSLPESYKGPKHITGNGSETCRNNPYWV